MGAERVRKYAYYAILLFSFLAGAVQSSYDEYRNTNEVREQLATLATSIEDLMETHYHARRYDRIQRSVSKLRAQQKIEALVICGKTPIVFPKNSQWEGVCTGDPRTKDALLHAAPLGDATFVLIADTSWIRRQTWQALARTTAVFATVGSLLFLFFQLQTRRLMHLYARILQHMIRRAMAGHRPHIPKRAGPFLGGHTEDLIPLTDEMSAFATRVLRFPEILNSNSLRNRDAHWLNSLRSQMAGKSLVVMANREPYIHVRKDSQVEVMRPASGLVTALEPILRQCGGLWIAHGSGNADRETSDASGEVAVPPDDPTYLLRRVWLSEAEENGYYYGFANEGLWPLCHLAHTRPMFRINDWEQYRSVNRKFSEVIPEHHLRGNSLILVQDYHFALLPRMLRERNLSHNASKVGLFWHIPWPNPEAFGICPWQRELLSGMLGSDLIGFHTQYHCNNFLESCNRYLEARVDMEHFSVTMGNHTTLVRAFPIGIDTSHVATLSADEKQKLKADFGIEASIIGVGVDRVDYTKGLLERFLAVERFFEKHPEYIKRFSFAQIGSPSRSNIPSYQTLARDILALVERINARFQVPDSAWKPIVFTFRHEDWTEIQRFYQLGDLCMVTSLHDGMNLVAKEYIWCQRPDRGALILSRFTGAARELTEAFLVNPYNIEEMADAIAQAIQLPPQERHRRMLSMRRKVESRNAYHWAADLVGALLPREGKKVVSLHG